MREHVHPKVANMARGHVGHGPGAVIQMLTLKASIPFAVSLNSVMDTPSFC